MAAMIKNEADGVSGGGSTTSTSPGTIAAPVNQQDIEKYRCGEKDEISDDLEAGRKEEEEEHHHWTTTPSGQDDVPDSVYDRFSNQRKLVIVVLLSFCSFLAPISSTTVLSATPEVAAEFHTTGSVVDVTNALYMLFMGISPIVWGPFSEVWGRKTITCVTAFLFFACSIGTALAPNLAAFFIFRILTAFEGTAFLLVGSACLQDIYRPTERATAMGWFLSGTLIGPAIGPFVGGIIVTFTSWRVIFWVQTALSGVAALGAFFLLPETIHHKKYDDLRGLSRKKKAAVLGSMVNPWKVLKLMFTYPNLLLAGIATASLVWNMYSLLTPIRYVLNPRFHLTSPMQSGLFYLAPGAGYLTGTFMGGRYADHIVRKYTRLSQARIPEDRMRSALPFLGVAIPACVLVYGWAVEKDVGGIALVVVTLFLQGVAQLFCFPSLNTYCLDVMQGRGSDVIAGNYFMRYLFACMGTAVVLPAIERVGVGWFSTISAAFLVVSALGTWATIIWGQGLWEEEQQQQ
ncbi:hypothetical protein M406DRAFT_63954 [Cryphonectria parasitica EP155]|uniref:Major facilitator superfamily (MFS) profile domain-containing protein n=1 Tax=Cryphonectria parasitica (strain ATCC 38755 / EP155) TaxID=660469 RepID=A0A9P4XTX2_CRYP1|nr:uncharacterized protein M406DRAFT_63954 [Cryphonectria parasitica EP155]KAF3760816.1 hypothetical protein M406DRAFT_63954 [Cryphonectria parasitica EP155]